MEHIIHIATHLIHFFSTLSYTLAHLSTVHFFATLFLHLYGTLFTALLWYTFLHFCSLTYTLLLHFFVYTLVHFVTLNYTFSTLLLYLTTFCSYTFPTLCCTICYTLVDSPIYCAFFLHFCILFQPWFCTLSNTYLIYYIWKSLNNAVDLLYDFKGVPHNGKGVSHDFKKVPI